jgi:lipoprotein-releasing system ATP-binding protein
MTALDPTTPLLEVRGLSKRFLHEGAQIEVLRHIDLTVHRGEQVAIVGQSGAGKSTLLHVLGTLDAPTGGEIKVAGQDVTRMNSRALAEFRNRTIGFMFQFHHLLPEFTALENAMMPLLMRRVRRNEARALAENWLERVGLSHRLTHRPGELSGGEQQRVALARALVGQPRLLMADEPTGNLDSRTSAGIHELFQSLTTEYGTAMLIVTHNAELARNLPRCLRMKDGGLVNEFAEGAGT